MAPRGHFLLEALALHIDRSCTVTTSRKSFCTFLYLKAVCLLSPACLDLELQQLERIKAEKDGGPGGVVGVEERGEQWEPAAVFRKASATESGAAVGGGDRGEKRVFV